MTVSAMHQLLWQMTELDKRALVCVNRMQISISREMEWEFSPKGQSLARIRHHNCHSYALGGSIAYNTDVVYM